MKAVKHIAGWSVAIMAVMMIIPVGVHTVRGSFLGRAWSYDFDISLWSAFSHIAPDIFGFLFWSAVWIGGLYAFFKWAGARIKMFPTLMTAGWIISGSVALFGLLITSIVPAEDWMGIDTVIEPMAWTAAGFFVARELIGLVDKIKSKKVVA